MISDIGKASHMPSTPTSSGKNTKHGTRNRNPRIMAKTVAGTTR